MAGGRVRARVCGLRTSGSRTVLIEPVGASSNVENLVQQNFLNHHLTAT